MYQKIFLTFFKNKKFRGVLELNFNNHNYKFGAMPLGKKSEKIIQFAKIEVKDRRFFKKLILAGDTGFGQAFLLNYFSTPDLKQLLLWFLQNKNLLPGFKDKNILSYLLRLTEIKLKIEHWLNKNTKIGSQRNIKEHYDVSNQFYKLWLDKTMAYSSAIFKGASDLKSAQENKYRYICEKLALKSGDHILEIGCGWGGFAVFASKNYDCYLTITTISQEQFNYTEALIKKENLASKIKLIKQDYRDLQGSFDKIVSIEMMEALGHEYVPLFLSRCQKLVKKGGLICLQCITYPDEYFQKYLRDSNFIKKYIFPGGELLSLGQIKQEALKLKLVIVTINSIGQDYARTLFSWRENFVAHKEDIMHLGFNEEFYRKWLYYFVYCEVGFETNYIDDIQILIKKD